MKIKRIYEPASVDDGYRVLIDRLFPRGIKKEDAAIDEWIKDLAPSTALRKWFHHDPELFPAFKEQYKKELEIQTEILKRLKAISRKQNLTLLYGAKDEIHNQAVVLLEVLQKMK